MSIELDLGQYRRATQPRPSSWPRRAAGAAALVVVLCAAGLAVARGYGLLVTTMSLGVVASLAPDRERLGWSIVGLVLFGYVAADKTFAYLGLNVFGVPMYAGEVAISAAVLTGLVFRRPDVRWDTGRGWTLAFIGWSLLLLMPSLVQYPLLDVARDFAFVYYILFAAIAFRLPWERLGQRFFSLVALMFVLQLLYALTTKLRLIPDDLGFAQVFVRGDVQGANLAGGAAFFLLADRRLRIPPWLRLLIASVQVLLALSVGGRAVLLAALILLLGSFFVRRARRARVMIMMLIGLAIFAALLGVSRPAIEVAGRNRPLAPGTSLERLTAILPLGEEGADSDLEEQAEGTARWRARFWTGLLNNSLEHKEWLVFGRGFGSNLAEERWAGRRERPLRAPHSILVNVFARMGIVGTVLFIGFLTAVIRAALRASRIGPDPVIANWMTIYLGALLMTAMFGVVLESPFGAAPFYFLVGGLVRLASLARPDAGTPTPSMAGRRTAV